jgi:RNA polymerase sigma-70 factor (ECF subfamily)
MERDEYSDPDGECVFRCRKGDVQAFEEIVGRYHKKMFNAAYRIIGDYNDAAEAVQDAFMSAFKNMGSFKGDAKFMTWLYTIVLNTSRNKRKQMQTRNFREDCSLDDPIEGDDGSITFEPASSNPSVLEQLEQHEVQQGVQRCIGELDHDFREALVLRDIQGFSYEEIRDMLDIAIGTVRSRIHRARLSIKECLTQLMKEF